MDWPQGVLKGYPEEGWGWDLAGTGQQEREGEKVGGQTVMERKEAGLWVMYVSLGEM